MDLHVSAHINGFTSEMHPGIASNQLPATRAEGGAWVESVLGSTLRTATSREDLSLLQVKRQKLTKLPFASVVASQIACGMGQSTEDIDAL